MPELPEVETLRRDLNKRLIGLVFSKVKVFNFKNITPSTRIISKKLLGLKVKDINRRGKLLIFKLSDQDINLLVHLKMTGQLIYQDKREVLAGGHSLSDNNSLLDSIGGKLPNRFTRVQFNFSNKAQLFFNDLRKFGYIKLVDRKKLKDILANSFGPEPLSKEFSLEFFSKLLKNRNLSIKALLLNQMAIAGLGNIYVDESLFIAKIKPNRLSSSLKKREVENLRLAIIDILTLAIKYRGTTFSDFVDLKGQKGNFSKFLQVYGRNGEKCFKCGSNIRKIKLAGRGTHYCPSCQF
jgi:formamidopyrimidine-DNA glycosylase